MKWHKATMDKREVDFVRNEMVDALMKTGSILIAPGLHARILDMAVDTRKIRVTDGLDKVWKAMPAARGCWVVSAALMQPSL
jgi:hypothetical protein